MTTFRPWLVFYSDDSTAVFKPGSSGLPYGLLMQMEIDGADNIWLSYESDGITRFTPDFSAGTNSLVSEPVTRSNPHKVYPNPAGGVLHVALDPSLVSSNMQFTLYTPAGRQVASEIVNPNAGSAEHTFSTDVSGLPPGLYIYRVQSGHESFSGKVLIR
jgi:hypothetical protein